LLGVAIMVLGQAGRNLTFAQEGHNAHLAAQSLMMVVREAFENASQNQATAVAPVLAAVIDDDARDIENYSIWITGAVSIEFHSGDVPETDIGFSGVPGLNISGNTTTIVVAIWNEHGHIAGRAIGVINQ